MPGWRDGWHPAWPRPPAEPLDRVAVRDDGRECVTCRPSRSLSYVADSLNIRPPRGLSVQAGFAQSLMTWA